MKPAHRRRRAPKGITSLETIVFVPVLVIFWLAFRYFAEEWTSVQLMGPVAGNAAYDRAMGKQPPGTAGLANQRSVTVNAAMQGPTDGSDYPYGVPWHLVDKKLANQRGGTAKVDIRIVPKPREYQSTWRVDRALAMSAVVQAPPTRPPVGQVGMDENAYNDKVQDFLNGKFQPFGW